MPDLTLPRSNSTAAVWRRLPEFDQAVAKRQSILTPHHHRDRAKPGMGIDDANGAGAILDHDIGQADRREARRIGDLGLRFEPGPVSIGLYAEVGQGDGYALHQITGVFRVENTPVFHTILTNPDRQLPIRGTQKSEFGHRNPISSPTVHLGFFEGENKSRCRGFDETYGALHTALSLITVIFSLFAAALLLGFL